MRTDIKFSEVNLDFRAKFSGNAEKRFQAGFSETTIITVDKDAEYYDGDYTVTPALKKQTLLTAQKQMREDVQINAIPYSEVSNTSGGTTVYIGSLID